MGGVTLKIRWRAVAGIMMALTLLSSLLAGCGGTGRSDGNAVKSSSTAAENTAEVKKPEDYNGTLTTWGWDANLIDKTSKEFNKVYPNVKIQLTNVAAGDYLQKMQTTIASGGELPDILWGAIGYRAKAFELDVWENLEKIPYNLDRKKIFDYLPSLTSNSKGQIVGLEQSISPAAMAYRRDLAKQYFGTDDPKQLEAMFPTYDAMIEKGKEVLVKSGGQVYMFASLGDVDALLSSQTKTPLMDGDTLNITGIKKGVLENIVKIRDAGIVDKLEQWSPQWNASYASGKEIFYPAANWSPQYVIKPNDKDGAGRWGLMNPPSGPFSWGGTVFGISKTSKNKELAWLYIHWLLATPEGAEVLKDKMNFFTSLKSVYDDKQFASIVDPFFAGQDIGKFWIEEALPKIDVPKITVYDSIVIDASGLILKWLNTNRDAKADEALSKLIKEVQGKLPDKKVK